MSFGSSSKLKSISKSTAMAVREVPHNETSLARRLWNKFKKQALAALLTPYIVCLGSGDLLMQQFGDCLNQDVLYFKAFVKAYQMAEDCIDVDDAESKAAVREMKELAVKALDSAEKFLQERGIKFEDITASSATIEYRNFLEATASGRFEDGTGVEKHVTQFEKTKVAAYTVAAMAPCTRLYAFLAKELRSVVDPSEGFRYLLYEDWIKSCSSQSFEEVIENIEDLLDKLNASLIGDELLISEKLYGRAMELERIFFATQPLNQQTIVPLSGIFDPAEHSLSVFSDFDLTCTVFDTADTLAEMVIQIAELTSEQNIKNTWESISADYTEDYERCVESVQPSEKENFNYESVRRALEQISDFEKQANEKIVESRVLRGLEEACIRRIGKDLLLQDGCIEFFQKIVQSKGRNVHVHIISDCWCADLIRSAFLSGGVNDLDIHANDLAYEESISTGEIVKRVESAIDKVEIFKGISEEQRDKDKHLSVYIGDSVGDLLCLLEADVGVVVGSSESLRTLATQFGIYFVPLFNGLVKQQKVLSETGSPNWKQLPKTLYTVSCWAEIHALILGTP